MSWWQIALLCIGSGTLGFMCAAILAVGKAADDEVDIDLEGTHCAGDAERFVHLCARRYDVARNGEHVALLEPETREIAFIGRSLRDIIDHSMKAQEPEQETAEHG